MGYGETKPEGNCSLFLCVSLLRQGPSPSLLQNTTLLLRLPCARVIGTILYHQEIVPGKMALEPILSIHVGEKKSRQRVTYGKALVGYEEGVFLSRGDSE